MKIKELIQKLQEYDQELELFFSIKKGKYETDTFYPFEPNLTNTEVQEHLFSKEHHLPSRLENCIPNYWIGNKKNIICFNLEEIQSLIAFNQEETELLQKLGG